MQTIKKLKIPRQAKSRFLEFFGYKKTEDFMKGLQSATLFLGRSFLSLMFLISAIHKILDWQGAKSSMLNAFYDWGGYIAGIKFLHKFFVAILPWNSFILVGIVFLELLGGSFVLFGIKPRIGAVLLLLFFIPSTILLHQFWFISDSYQKEMQFALFFKNLAIIGGLLYVLIFGARIKQAKAPSKNG